MMMIVKWKYKTKFLAIVLLFFIAGSVNIFSFFNVLSENKGKNPDYAINLQVDNDLTNYEEMADFDMKIQSFMHQWGIVGAAVGVVKNGKLVYVKGYGYADKENEVETQPFHLFRIASVSKLITAVAIMKLKEEGFLSLDDYVFGPDGILNDSMYSEIKDTAILKIKVSHLLNHSGGWELDSGDFMFMPHQIARKMKVACPPEMNTIIRYVLANSTLEYEPGKMSSYSNFGYSVLGKVIEKVSGTTYEAYVQEYILRPVGISDMHIAKNLKEDKYRNEVSYYVSNQQRKTVSIYNRKELVPRQYGGNDVEVLGPAGGWVASAIDLMKLIVSIDGKDFNRDLLEWESISEMATEPNDSLDPYGWVDVTEYSWWRTGSFTGSHALLVHQENNVSWVILSNTSTKRKKWFSRDLGRLMTSSICNTKKWPQENLFDLSPLHENISTIKLENIELAEDGEVEVPNYSNILSE